MAGKYCKNCGTKLPDGVKYCPKCGTPVIDQNANKPSVQKKSDHKSPVLFVIIIAVIAAVCCAGTIVFLHHRNNSHQKETAASVTETARTEVRKSETTAETEKEDASVLPETTAKSTPANKTKSSDYLLPDSDTRKITASDLSEMSAKDLTYARNEIYARHGKVFKHNELNRYFQTKSWYHADSSFQDIMTSDLEQANAGFILQYQKDNGLEYTPGD